MNAAVLGVLVVILALPAVLSAAPGDLDPTFGTGGKVRTSFNGNLGSGFASANAATIQSDGKVVVVGTATPPEFIDVGTGHFYTFTVARYNTDGSLDTGFGTGGIVFINASLEQEANAVLVQPVDGKIVVGGGQGSFLGQPGQHVLARFNTDGSRDMSFGTNGLVTGAFADCGFIRSIRALALQPADGKIVAALQCQGGVADKFLVARFNANGQSANGTGLDTSFGSGDGVATPLDGAVSVALALQADGKIVVAGSSEATFAVVRLNPGGTLDTTFSGDGRVIVNFPQIGTFPADFSRANALAIDPDGKIIVAGRRATRATDPLADFALARLNPDATLDTTFSGDGRVITDLGGNFDQANGLAIQADGKIVVVGRVGSVLLSGTTCFSSSVPPDCNFALVRYNADGSLDTAFGGAGKVITDFSGPVGPLEHEDSEATAVALQADGRIVVAGTVTLVGGEVGEFALARYLGDGANTPAGSNVVVQVGPVTLTFDNVTQAGTTTLTTSTTGPPPPAGFRLGNPPIYFDINTTAVSSGTVQVCINYSGIAFGDEATLKLSHFEDPNWVDATPVSLDTANDIICGSVTSLSPFAIFEPASQPFATFRPEVEIELPRGANNDTFEVEAFFTLGALSNGIKPLTEAVSFKVGSFSTPALSFKQKKGRFKFEGIIGGVRLSAQLRPSRRGGFKFEAEGKCANLDGTMNPVTVELNIGDDRGGAEVTADIESSREGRKCGERRDDDKDDKNDKGDKHDKDDDDD